MGVLHIWRNSRWVTASIALVACVGGVKAYEARDVTQPPDQVVRLLYTDMPALQSSGAQRLQRICERASSDGDKRAEMRADWSAVERRLSTLERQQVAHAGTARRACSAVWGNAPGCLAEDATSAGTLSVESV
eukprot:ctg_1471.g496